MQVKGLILRGLRSCGIPPRNILHDNDGGRIEKMRGRTGNGEVQIKPGWTFPKCPRTNHPHVTSVIAQESTFTCGLATFLRRRSLQSIVLAAVGIRLRIRSSIESLAQSPIAYESIDHGNFLIGRDRNACRRCVACSIVRHRR